MNIPGVIIARRLVSSTYLLAFSAFLSGVAIVVFLITTSPLDIGPNGILFVFSLLYACLTFSTLLGIKALIRVVKWRPSTVKRLYISTIGAFAPVMLLALNTLNQLQAVDVVLVATFVVLSLFYVLKRVK